MSKIPEQFNAATFHSSQWLKAFHIQGRVPQVVRITGMRAGKYKDEDKQQSLFLSLSGHTRELGLRGASIEQLSEMFGRDIRAWKGQLVMLTIGRNPNGTQTIDIGEAMESAAVYGEDDGGEFDPFGGEQDTKKKSTRKKSTKPDGARRKKKRKKKAAAE